MLRVQMDSLGQKAGTILGKLGASFQPEHTFYGNAIERSETYWQFGLFFLLLVLVAVARLTYPYKFRQLWESFFASRYMKQVVREEMVLAHPFSFLLLLNFSLVLSLLGYLLLPLLDLYLPLPGGLLLFGICAGAILGYLFLKTMLLKVVQFIIGEDGGQTENRYTFLLFTQVSGLVLLPALIFTTFGPEAWRMSALYASLGLFVLIYAYRLGRGLFVGRAAGSSIFHLFLYLCTLEIIPLIIAVKVLMSESG